MQVNGYQVNDRFQRPTVLQRVGLRNYFINNGSYQDPYAISSVSVFYLTDNSSPSSLLTSSNLLDPTICSAVIKMNFMNSAVEVSNSVFNASTYVPAATASGIYKLATGDFVAILDGTVSLSSTYNGSPIVNSCSTVGEYIDVWTVKWLQNSDWQIFINRFNLSRDTLFTVTEPLLLSANTKLINKRIRLKSKVDLKVPVEITIGNRNLTDPIKNIFKTCVLTDVSMQIVKLNEVDTPLNARVTVSSFANTSSVTQVTNDNVILLNFDTNSLFTLPQVMDGSFGNVAGTYTVQVKFTVLNQTFYSELMALVIE